jgi:8-oxo-dGTP diphosphatase
LRTRPIFHIKVNKSLLVKAEMTNNPTILIVVAAALTNESGACLLQRRPEGRAMAGLWEFPGGKLEIGETPELALVRELNEELGIEVALDSLRPLTFAMTQNDGRPILLLLYHCAKWRGVPLALDEQILDWVLPQDMDPSIMPPADAPFIDCLLRLNDA